MSGDLDERLEAARGVLARAEADLVSADAAVESARDGWGGLVSFGGSGSQSAARKARAASWKASERYRDALRARDEAARRVSGIEARIAERDRVRLTRADVEGTSMVRTRLGWHRVVRVNAKSVTVETGHSWTDRYAFADVLEVRKAVSS